MVRPRRPTLTLLVSAVMSTLPLSRPAGLVAGEQPAESGLAASSSVSSTPERLRGVRHYVDGMRRGGLPRRSSKLA